MRHGVLLAVVVLSLSGCGGGGSRAAMVASAIQSGTAGGLGSLGNVTKASCTPVTTAKGKEYRCTASTAEGVAQLLCFPDDTSAGGSFCAITARP